MKEGKRRGRAYQLLAEEITSLKTEKEADQP